MAVGIGLGLYLGRYSKKFLLWIKRGIENGDGVLENKELQIIWFSLLSGFLILSIALFGIKYPDAIIYCTFGAATGMYIGRQFSKKKDDDNRDKLNEGEF